MAYEYKNNPQNPDAIPLYNDNILKFWNWFDDVWDCNDWMNWHISMNKKYGNTIANNNFLKHWNDLATASSAIDCRTFNSDFRTYMKNVGLLDALYSGVGIISKPIGGTIEVAGNVGSGIISGSKVLKVAIPLIIIIGVVFLIMYLSKQVKKS